MAEKEHSTSFDRLVTLYRDAVLAAYNDWYYFLNPIIGLTESEGKYCGEQGAEFFPATHCDSILMEKAASHYEKYRHGLVRLFWDRLGKCCKHVFLIDVFAVFQTNREEVNAAHLKDQQALLDDVFQTIARRRTKLRMWNPLTYGRLLRKHWTGAIRSIHFVASKADLFPEDDPGGAVQHRGRLKDYLSQYLDDNLLLLRSSLDKVTIHSMSAMVCTETQREEGSGALFLLPRRGAAEQERMPYKFSNEGLPQHLEEVLREQYGPFCLAPPKPTPLGTFPHWRMEQVVSELFRGII
jgi:hypothetical protein